MHAMQLVREQEAMKNIIVKHPEGLRPKNGTEKCEDTEQQPSVTEYLRPLSGNTMLTLC
jgi:hypothetical protein